MSATRHRTGLLSLLAISILTSTVSAQQPVVTPPQAVSKPVPVASSSTAPLVDTFELPEFSGPDAESYQWNAGLGVTSIHTSTTGWATLGTPSVGYRFNDIFSVDAVLPIYFYRLAESRSSKPKPTATLVNQRGELADMVLSGHAQFLPRFADYQITGAVTAPIGDKAYGLTTGRVTFDISNQFERTFGRFTPTIEIGGGDSSTLVNRLVTKTYTSLGPLAHFQAGLSSEISPHISLESDAYEQLPIGDQKIYTSKTTKNKTTTVVTGYNVTEDNGFNSVLSFTIDGHTTLSSYYSRSLRLHTDTASVGLTYFLRSTAPVEDASLDDLFR